MEALDHLLGVASSKNREAEAILFARTIRNLSFLTLLQKTFSLSRRRASISLFAEMPIERPPSTVLSLYAMSFRNHPMITLPH